ncbi:CsbD family protein [Rhodococcus sp. SRB_17]|nr:CsbD family protein [Rhodococcus sp. SRB_17]
MSMGKKIHHKVETAEGAAKKAFGKATGDAHLEAEGSKEQAKGNAKQMGDKVKDAGKKIKNAFKH